VAAWTGLTAWLYQGDAMGQRGDQEPAAPCGPGHGPPWCAVPAIPGEAGVVGKNMRCTSRPQDDRRANPYWMRAQRGLRRTVWNCTLMPSIAILNLI
jgi:hypothetical protein